MGSGTTEQGVALLGEAPALPEPTGGGARVWRAAGPEPCPAAPGPIHRPRAEECRHEAWDWQAAPPATPAGDPLGEASWAPELGGDLENFYV